MGDSNNTILTTKKSKSIEARLKALEKAAKATCFNRR